MQELREFLEGSTIHGLAHISTARPTALKVAWVLVVAPRRTVVTVLGTAGRH